MLNINKKKENTTLTVILDGDLDRTTAPELESSITKELQDITDLVVDLEKLNYISSAGLRSFVKFRKIMDKQGKMSILNIGTGVQEILDLSGLTGFLTNDK